jgi:carbamoyltransferase
VTPNLCLSGGTSLNCPSNSRIARESPFPSIFIEPNCDDGGLSVGAALFVHHNLLDQPVLPSPKPMSPYLGGAYDQKATMSAAATFGNAVRTQVVSNAPAAAAAELAQDRVIGWFEGRSEIGPRALGHRSILAEATRPENWARVNRIKGREAWRPFAPAVLEADAAEWFRGCPAQSPYMLFTAQVASQQLPAITHVDGSARIQTVGPDAGGFYELLRAYKAATGIPAILNTSFNGPGDPIVEAPAEAIGFLMGSELDAIYLDGVRIERAR